MLPAIAAGLASVFGGAAVVATRAIIDESDPLSLAVLRYGISGVIMLALALAQIRIRLAKRDVVPIIVLSLLQFAGFGYFFISALAYIPAARGALVLSTMPLATLVLASVIGRERLTRLKLVGVVLTLVGIAIALGDRTGAGEQAWKGDLMMATAVGFGTLYTTLSAAYLRRYSALMFTATGLPIGTIALLLCLAATGDLSGLVRFSPAGWLGVAFLGTIGGAASFYLWIWALERTTPTRVAIMITLNPLTSAILGWLVLAEPITWYVLAGLICVLSGIVLANWRERARP